MKEAGDSAGTLYDLYALPRSAKRTWGDTYEAYLAGRAPLVEKELSRLAEDKQMLRSVKGVYHHKGFRFADAEIRTRNNVLTRLRIEGYASLDPSLDAQRLREMTR